MYVFLAHSKGPAALSVSIAINTADPLIDTAGSQTSGSGEIDMVATASGGDGSYSFAWTLLSENDPQNAFSINMGTVNRSSGAWNDAIVTTTFTGPPGPGNDPPLPAEFTVRCTVTDGTGATATAEEVTRAEAL
ncbi:MAG: hypothetical protein CMB45_03105 [Euryarchaeota archaeon]|mgnify:FL=1|nr:hypothetical protein [Euryarchaeota archaeon]|tara:strand:+ start:1434 stop:1835 length:402 start_codon:yes stop_codon:yes gene_type:complete